MIKDEKEKIAINQGFTRFIFILVGTIFLFIGIIGIIIPLLPTTPFLLLAAACYARGSKRWYNWLVTNRIFGKYIRNYHEGKTIPLKIRILLTIVLWGTIIISIIIINNRLVTVILLGIALIVSIHIMRTNSTKM